MNASSEVRFLVRERSKGETEFFYPEDAESLERALLSELDRLPLGGTLVVDFTGVRMASSAARQLLKRAIGIVQSHENKGYGLVLSGLGRGVYNIESMLVSEKLSTVYRRDDGAVALLGAVDAAVDETYKLLVRRRTITAADVRRAFELNTIAAATNRLTRLARLGAARRIGQESVEGGGLQFRYEPVK